MGSNEPVVIVSTSGYAAEVASICDAMGLTVGAIVGTGSALDAAASLGIEFVEWRGEVGALPPGPVAVALGDAAERARVRAELWEPPLTLAHPAATLGLAVELGAGCIVSPGAVITSNVVLGSGTLVHTGAILSHDDRLGDDVTVSPAATLCGGVTVGDRAWIAAGATVLPGLTIGEEAVVGGGALVRKDVAARTTVTGVPARPRRDDESVWIA